MSPPAHSPYNPYGEMIAAARITVGGAFADTKPYGFTSVALAANVFTLTLRNQIDPSAAIVKVSNANGSAVAVQAEHLTDSTIDVTGIAGADVLTPVAFHIAVFRKAMN